MAISLEKGALLFCCLGALTMAAIGRAQAGPPSPQAFAQVAATPTPKRAEVGADAAVLPPEGWWVPATIKLPKAAEGRVAWRFMQRELITVDKDNQLERRAIDLKSPKAGIYQTETPLPMLLELDDKQHTLTVTVLKPKAAFFILNRAGAADAQRFDSLLGKLSGKLFDKPIVVVPAESDELRTVCDKAASCARRTGHDELLAGLEEGKGPGGGRTLMSCRDALSTMRQELAFAHHSIPSVCR